MIELTQKDRTLQVDTPLGPDVLVLTDFSGHEELSRLFLYRLQLISSNHAIDANKIVGKGVTFNVRLLDGSRRYFHGFVSSFSYDGTDDRTSHYSAEVVPWLWFLTLTTDCRIYRGSAVKILEQVFDRYGFRDAFEAGGVKGKHPDWKYRVQYGESAFNFVSRLMEQEGIFYYFKHAQGKHTLVLGDDNSAFQDCSESSVALSEQGNQIRSWQHSHEYCSGKWSQTDYDFHAPTTSLLASSRTVLKLDNIEKFGLFDYPGQYTLRDEGDVVAKVRMESQEVAHSLVRAQSLCRTFNAGGRFKLSRHPSAAEMGKSYVIMTIQHTASLGGSAVTGAGAAGFDYRNEVTCFPAQVPFRPIRCTPRPSIHGTQTAVVKGPGEIHTDGDGYGMIQLHFHWDREPFDEKTATWVRVSHSLAGSAWGSIALPRVDQEVVVGFLDGDPDRPIVTGVVYNGDHMPPFSLPDLKMVSGVKTQSTPEASGYNEISLNDKAGEELITVHAQYDMRTTIEHDEDHAVVTGNRTLKVKTGTNTETIEGDSSHTVNKGEMTVTVNAGSCTTTASDAVVVHGKAKGVQITGNSKGVTIKGDGTGIEITGQPSVKVEGTEVELRAPGGSIKIDSTGITLTGTMIKSTASATHEISGVIVKIN